MELETCPFGELRHGTAAFEAVVAHARADGGGEVPIAATCVHVDEALSQRLGQSARSLAFAWVSPEGVIPATHIWPLRPTQAFQQWARAGHTFALHHPASCFPSTPSTRRHRRDAIDATRKRRSVDAGSIWSRWAKRAARTSPRVRCLRRRSWRRLNL